MKNRNLILDKMDDVGILLTNLAKYSYEKDPLRFKLESDKILQMLSVRLGPFTKIKTEKNIEKLKVPKDAKKND